jgi:hypothetical protein
MIGPERPLRNAARVFTGEIGNIVGGAKCHWSPEAAEWQIIQAALISKTTVFPSGLKTPGCWQSLPRQIVYTSGISLNSRGGVYANAPAFVFLRKRQATAPAVVEIP